MEKTRPKIFQTRRSLEQKKKSGGFEEFQTIVPIELLNQANRTQGTFNIVPGTGNHSRHHTPGGEHRHHEHHDGIGDGTNPGNRNPARRRRLPHRTDDPLAGGHHLMERLRFIGRIGRHRHLLRNVPGVPGGPNKSRGRPDVLKRLGEPKKNPAASTKSTSNISELEKSKFSHKATKKSDLIKRWGVKYYSLFKI